MVDDVPGARTIQRHVARPNGTSYENINYTDVTKVVVKSKRSTNPISPTYVVQGEAKGVTEEIGFVNGSEPSKFGSRPSPNYDNTTNKIMDVHGAQASTKGLGVFANAKRREE